MGASDGRPAGGELPRQLMDVWCRDLVGAVGHHWFFSHNAAAQERLSGFVRDIRRDGVDWFLREHYPRTGEKRVIVNQIGGRFYLVDGNAHMLALVLANPGIRFSGLVDAVGHGSFARFWRDGWEEGSGQVEPYETYIPFDTDTERLPSAREGYDAFKPTPERIKIIPSNIPFDSPLLSERDRGRPLGETAEELERLGAIR